MNVEIALLTTYLPAQLSDEALEAIIQEAITQSGISGKEAMGKAMGVAMKAVAGKADGTRVKQVVERLLSVFALVAVGLITSAPANAAIDFLNSSSIEPASYDLVLGLRVIRVCLLWIGVFAVNSILNGGFSYMTSGMRDAEHTSALGKITTGFVGSIVVVMLFVITTIYIQIL